MLSVLKSSNVVVLKQMWVLSSAATNGDAVMITTMNPCMSVGDAPSGRRGSSLAASQAHVSLHAGYHEISHMNISLNLPSVSHNALNRGGLPARR